MAKQTALQHVLNSLRVMYARDAVVAALSSSIKVEDNSTCTYGVVSQCILFNTVKC